jgi:hypothetical protein
MAPAFEFNCRRGMHAQILCAMDKWENAVPLIANSVYLKGNALSCNGNLS